MLPAAIYKYIPVDSDERIDRLKRLISGWLYFSSPLYFNDPFEMSPVLIAPGRDDFKKTLRGMGINHKFFSKSARDKILGRIASTLANRTEYAVSKEWLESIGVACFGTEYTDLLMWAHYAANHTGLCLSFDTSYKLFSSVREVRYTVDRPHVSSVSFIQEDEELVKSVLLHKSPHWAYEKEWRAVKRPIREDELDYYKKLLRKDDSRHDEIAELLASEGGPGVYQFDPGAIQNIYFGARMPEESKEKLAGLIKESIPHARVFEMQLDRRRYQLNRLRRR